MYILGISCFYHDGAACLIKDGEIVAAAEEERFTRVKHDFSFPVNAIRFCLKEAKITIDQVDYIGFYEKPFVKFDRILSQHLEMWPKSFLPFYLALPSWINEKLRLPRMFKKNLKSKVDILYIPHHLSHAASCFLVSPFEKAAILTVDGVGEWQTTTYGIGEGNEIKLLKEIDFPNSLGLLYSAMTGYLGFKVNNDEYKVMGLAPYGNPIYVDKLRQLIDVKDDGSYQLDMDYFCYHYKMAMANEKFIAEFGPARKREAEVEQHHKDMAASLQKLLEEILIKILNHIYKVTGQKNICIAGGVGLNSVANGKILKNTPFENIYIQPAAGDAGGSIGTAFYIYNTLLKQPRRQVQVSAFLGPEFSTEEIKQFLEANKINYQTFADQKELISKVAKLIYDNNVVGWFQGRMEWGPRALGSRSILSNPTNPKMKDILNLKVKHREAFRPFAPVICLEDANEYFEADNPIPLPTDFMLMVYPIKKEKQPLIPAVTHVDGSGRLQTIRRQQNPLYYDLVKEFGRLSGVPILINTSFNIRGEPIVCTPYDAYRCMMGTGIDYLIIDKFLVRRDDNPKDMWDSEEYAKD
jgi:carbamoyltransferase